MKILLVLMMFFPTGEIQIYTSVKMETVEECVNKAMLVNQDQQFPYTAFCHYNIEEDDQKRL